MMRSTILANEEDDELHKESCAKHSGDLSQEMSSLETSFANQ